MKKGFKLALSLLLLFALTSLAACNNDSKTDASKDGKSVTLTILHNWNGSAASAPKDPLNNPVAKKIKEETGVTVKFTYAKKSEVETANEAFATGNLPDIYDGPAWGGEAQVLLKAANEGQLVDLTKYLDKYPNLKKFTKKENMSQTLYDTVFKKQKNGQYFLTEQYPKTKADIQDWLYGLYVRKDIAKKLGIDPQSVKTKEDLYNFLVKIKNANLKTADGKSIFPLGSYGNGFALGIMSQYFAPIPGDTGWMISDSGKAKMNFMTKNWDEYTMYMRKLLKEGLLDPKSFTQSGPAAQEKITQGRYAVVPTQFPQLYVSERQFVKDNPDKNFVPLGPIKDINGNQYKTVFNVQGSQLIAIPKSSKNVDAALKVLNYLASDEGYILTHFGIKGVHYDMVNGKPKAKKEWVDKLQDDPKALTDLGIGGPYADLSGFYRDYSLAGGPYGYQYNKRYDVQNEFTKIMRPDGIKASKGKDAGAFVQDSKYYDQLKPIFDTIGDVWRQAVYAESDQKAEEILNQTRKALKDAGIDKVTKKINKEVQNGTNFVRYTTPN
ncbi:carbohydrate ABC transporter substrate-binding protein (CUT1 family) [Scopulibacillus darangshiensis]|uniref:Carbohydrate ABC transporter substrate-binding protein (CUT1 family) n=1 Tax=Scopulibacillus darangshiensis TaxID=442528 RepID=A0A4R2NIW0_9BACL|nr:extracellular solute-binding protein [Scopulibacillus darangshiensis]TCP21340.1 carbohydrate ABC transporter substrate-binding protein (CUT1 family) [Scopulibacillus darangshiensis]